MDERSPATPARSESSRTSSSEYFRAAPRELARVASRQIARLRCFTLERKLAKAETDLGLLGWQQADFDAETEAQVKAIINCEREQARLTNESAEVGGQLRRLREQRETARRNAEEARSQLQERRTKLLEPHAELERQLEIQRSVEPTFETRIPELDRELREANRLYNELLGYEPQTPQIRAELTRLREQTVAIPNQKSDLRRLHLRAVTEIRSLEARLEKDRLAAAAIDEELSRLESEFKASDEAAAVQIRALEREKVRIEKESDSLEEAKANPYQQIGRVLADSNIAPINQPDALEYVRQLRFQLAELRHRIARSRKRSRSQDPAILWISWVLFTVAMLLASIFVAVVVQ